MANVTGPLREAVARWAASGRTNRTNRKTAAQIRLSMSRLRTGINHDPCQRVAKCASMSSVQTLSILRPNREIFIRKDGSIRQLRRHTAGLRLTRMRNKLLAASGVAPAD